MSIKNNFELLRDKLKNGSLEVTLLEAYINASHDQKEKNTSEVLLNYMSMERGSENDKV